MGQTIFDVLYVYIMDLIKMVLIIWGLLRFRLKSVTIVMITIVAGNFICVMGSQIINNDFFYSNGIAFVLLFTLLLIINGKFLRKFTVILLSYFILMFLDICVAGLMSMIFNSSYMVLLENKVYNFIGNIFTLSLIGIIIIIKKYIRVFNGKKLISKKVFALIFTGVGITTFFVGSLVLIDYPHLNETIRNFVLLTMILISFAYLGACLLLILITDARDNYRFLSQVNQSVIEAQQKYYMLAQEKQQEIYGIRHEIKNHLACISALNSMGKSEEMSHYINQLIEETNEIDALFDTGNGIVNSILNDVAYQYKQHQIGVKLEGGFPEQLKIAPMDLCIIFANALMNAVEAIQKIDNPLEEIRYIKIKIGSYKGDLFIDIWNPVSQKVEIHKGKLTTTKNNKSRHGFGTQNMRVRVEKYKGTLEFICNEQEFHVSIFMENPLNQR